MPDIEVGDINCDNSTNTTALILESLYNTIIMVKGVNVNILVQINEFFLNKKRTHLGSFCSLFFKRIKHNPV
jgi:hypothetical protein